MSPPPPSSSVFGHMSVTGAFDKNCRHLHCHLQEIRHPHLASVHVPQLLCPPGTCSQHSRIPCRTQVLLSQIACSCLPTELGWCVWHSCSLYIYICLINYTDRYLCICVYGELSCVGMWSVAFDIHGETIILRSSTARNIEQITRQHTIHTNRHTHMPMYIHIFFTLISTKVCNAYIYIYTHIYIYIYVYMLSTSPPKPCFWHVEFLFQVVCVFALCVSCMYVLLGSCVGSSYFPIFVTSL